ARQRRLQQVGSARAPRHDIVDLEGDADAEQQRHRDDVGKVERQPDRKSTRLNSSHVSISYAGFCLKKKTERHLVPNEARNIGLRRVRTRYVVFIDNDAVPAPGWLERMVECAEETGAWVVGPLYLV